MKIYFTTSVRPGRQNREACSQIVRHLKNYGEVLGEQLGNTALTEEGESIPDEDIHARNLKYIEDADIIIAEITVASTGVGYDLGRAVEKKKKILCLKSKDTEYMSAMIGGCKQIEVLEYDRVEDALMTITKFIRE